MVKDHHCVPPEADGPVFLSGVWCHVSPATDKVCGRSPGQAVSPELSAPDGVAAYIRTGVTRWTMIKKIRAPRSNSTRSLQRPAPARPDIQGLGVERPDSAIDNGVALIFSGQINM
jgi:hypothetical protein